jgi:hypothetical protein
VYYPVKIMLAIVIVIIMLMAAAAASKPGNPVDRSDHDLVRQYLAMPCDGLDEIYSFLYDGMVHMTAHYKDCLERADSDPNFKYGYLKCYYVRMEWDMLDKHASSIEKAWNLMCDDWGERKNPEYDIDF